MKMKNAMVLSEEKANYLRSFNIDNFGSDQITIIDLIEFLPESVKFLDNRQELSIEKYQDTFYSVSYCGRGSYCPYVEFINSQLIDALFDMTIWILGNKFNITKK